MARSDASLPLIHPSAWKKNSPKFAYTAFSEVAGVRASFRRLASYLAVELVARFADRSGRRRGGAKRRFGSPGTIICSRWPTSVS